VQLVQLRQQVELAETAQLRAAVVEAEAELTAATTAEVVAAEEMVK
jgi:hypothetical protein